MPIAGADFRRTKVVRNQTYKFTNSITKDSFPKMK
jgi:hypothetical protein